MSTALQLVGVSFGVGLVWSVRACPASLISYWRDWLPRAWPLVVVATVGSLAAVAGLGAAAAHLGRAGATSALVGANAALSSTRRLRPADRSSGSSLAGGLVAEFHGWVDGFAARAIAAWARARTDAELVAGAARLDGRGGGAAKSLGARAELRSRRAADLSSPDVHLRAAARADLEDLVVAGYSRYRLGRA